jgi:hypothetical protein
MLTRTRIALGTLATIVHRTNPGLRLLLPAALLAVGLGPALPALAGTTSPTAGTADTVRKYTGKFPDGAYLIQVPAK